MLLPQEQMPGVFENDKAKNNECKIGQWVRIKNSGAYGGDIGLVEGTEESKVYIRLIPRIDLTTNPTDKPKKFNRPP